ncbi:hypothetical protein A3K48_00005 [candidate division WOR-1 bacterium RIFOXYA12_FULL_52_29]|uniref:histidine kinase n=1 Tax=candidate division WOR-1 bacterium RIFOXYC12_FULL_54_18 TaxID=1802584 RepID=A0A1F4T4D4_UNCSA|nr:MAG: hypothetical protein A3K44_00005 [candidate division WOR-1 bacterium RIFOXYA2_FULL_51_19]OGC16990.1 MAG: hypothetical protein A3K48_00005 [candidate division WOR-1 bacterium RIFOXYA12_FULL_52_29]OGC25851.1 MAG: hypothetical protein A3K32_00005 [candidate division WOR-1 bacterium RIFOXYB2_FULL_45_9]OGC27407.1 MAG: hypothetical protein A3K49_00005 [candidate division WOR-1 bacterium RIFOXYC12_FULL_54_18]
MEFNTISILVVALSSFLLGLAALFFGKEKVVNLTLAMLSLSIGVWCFGQFMGAIVPGREEVLFWTRLNIGGAVLIPFFFLCFSVAFTGKLPKEKSLIGAALLLAAAFLLFDLTRYFVADVAPIFGLRYYPVAGIVYPYFGIYVIVLFAIGFTKLVKQLQVTVGEARNQVKYVLLASLIGFLGGMTAFFPILGLDLPVISHYFMPLYLALILYAVVRHKLLDINIVLFEGLVYSFLTFLFTGFYLLALILLNRLFANVIHLNNWLALGGIVFASVIIFQPLRDLVQKFIDRLFFRGEYYYIKKINDLSAENDKLAALGTMAAGMAHEIKNPLAAIKGLTQVLPENLSDRRFIADYSEIVPRQLDRINKIVDDLLAFGRPGKMVFRGTGLGRLINGTLKLLARECQNQRIKIELEPLPDLTVDLDAERFGQAFLNICLNAIQAMPDGGTLKINLMVAGEKAVIEIADTGIGIPADKLALIFDPFFTTKGRGTGLGLAVTYRIVQEHGGEIGVTSRPGEGTTFKICLPIKQKR